VVDLCGATSNCGCFTDKRDLNGDLHLSIGVDSQEVHVLNFTGYWVDRDVAHEAQFLTICSFDNNVDGGGLAGGHEELSDYWGGSLEDQWVTARAVKMQRSEAASSQCFVLAAKGGSGSCFK
jgi:hypothetical protein